MRVVLVELAKTRASVCGVVPRSPSLTWVNPEAPAGRSEGTRGTLSAGLPPGLGDAELVAGAAAPGGVVVGAEELTRADSSAPAQSAVADPRRSEVMVIEFPVSGTDVPS